MMKLRLNMAKFAFTLAETLITLGTIGVVAAITIPGLMTAYKKHATATKLERAVSVINQAIRLSENENGQMENWNKNLSEEEFINTYFRPFMTIMQVCNTSNPCGYYQTSTAYIWSYLSGAYGVYGSPFNTNRQGLQTADGFMYFFSKASGSSISQDNDKMIIIDLNGSDKPNVLGKDVFFFLRDEESDSIIPYGGDKSYDTIKNDCKENGVGLYCAALIRQNGWKIPNNYPKL